MGEKIEENVKIWTKSKLWHDAVCTFQRKLFDIWLLCDGVTDDAIWILELK